MVSYKLCGKESSYLELSFLIDICIVMQVLKVANVVTNI